jgi:Fe-S-cluster-containing hydrogenase component 2
MSLRLVVRPHLCTGCNACELACAFTHGENGRPGTSRCNTVTVGVDEHVPVLCLQCEHAACIQVCPVGAIHMDPETRVVLIDQERCIQCLACSVACPFGNIVVEPGQHTVHKCDLCAGHGDYPRCALFCPTQCLMVEHVEHLAPAEEPEAAAS